ncbi:hypothetical protein PtA15_7A605 [Puccinia triticina]|uniref:DUF7872 domain-containing protein n=1 Tax=Puccinia triticina TaxID=208348 RepID=A0ABY7CRY5_9BASI|nr:uncharacterized protein PtA15_7A605 [Puccinia triticina]WAQ86876.1 hypothetical protein PtA15_7A605 [Puccinia triticina]
MDLELDSYLLNYPNGDKMTLIEYATSKNASNFVCGLGSICNAGQMCYPVPDNDWYILFALQQWNSMNNILYMSIGYAISIVQAADLSGAIHAKQSLGVSAGMMEVSGTLAMDIMIMLGSETGPIGWALNVLNFGLTGGFGFWAYFQKVPKGPIIEGFGIWTDVVFHLATVEQEAHKRLSEGIKKAINAPISSPDGIYGVLKGGTYLSPAKVLPIPEIADKFRNVTMAMAMNLVLRGMNCYITIGADKCTDKGKDGAWPQADRLSYCPNRGGPMHNIVRAVDKLSVNGIPNAKVIDEIFGFSTKMIIDVSLDCQKKHKDWNYNPYTNGKFPKSQQDECVFNVPVCDCRDEDLRLISGS